MIQLKPDREAFDKLCEDYTRATDNGRSQYFNITARQIVDILGWPAVEILLMCGDYDKEQFSELLRALKLVRGSE